MTKKCMIVIDNNAYRCRRSNAKNLKDRAEEDLAVFAPQMLDNLYRNPSRRVMRQRELSTPMDFLMYSYKKVAKYYKVDATELLAIWVRDYGHLYATNEQAS